jgi:hypothetical protein
MGKRAGRQSPEQQAGDDRCEQETSTHGGKHL